MGNMYNNWKNRWTPSSYIPPTNTDNWSDYVEEERSNTTVVIEDRNYENNINESKNEDIVETVLNDNTTSNMEIDTNTNTVNEEEDKDEDKEDLKRVKREVTENNRDENNRVENMLIDELNNNSDVIVDYEISSDEENYAVPKESAYYEISRADDDRNVLNNDTMIAEETQLDKPIIVMNKKQAVRSKRENSGILFDSRPKAVTDAEKKKDAEAFLRINKVLYSSDEEEISANQSCAGVSKKNTPLNNNPKRNIPLTTLNNSRSGHISAKEKRINKENAKANETREKNEISNIHKDSRGNVIREEIEESRSMLEEPVYLNPYRDTRRTTIPIKREVTLFNNIVNNFRKMQIKANGLKSKKEVKYQYLNLNKEEEGVLRVVMAKLGLYHNYQIQKFFNEQANTFAKDVKDEDIERIRLNSGIVLRLLNSQIKEVLNWDSRKKSWEFKKLEALKTGAIRRDLTVEEKDFMNNDRHKCMIIRDIIDLDNDLARAWLNPDEVIEQTRKCGEKVLKGVKNKDSVFDPHRLQANVEDMENPYMEGLGVEMEIIAEQISKMKLDLVKKSLIRERGASEQCKHTDKLEARNIISMFLPTYNTYQLAVYQYKGLNEYNQEVLDQYILEANIGDIVVIKSDFLHNGVESEEKGTLIFAYGNDPNVRRSRVREGGKVNLLDNRKMRSGRYKYKICVKGKLVGDNIIDADSNHRIKGNEVDMLTLGTLLNKRQLNKYESNFIGSEYILFLQNVILYTLTQTVNMQIILQIVVQLGVATGEVDMEFNDCKIKEIYDGRYEKRRSNKKK